MAVDDLFRAHLQWGKHVQKLITHRFPYTDFDTALHQHNADEIKAVLEWNSLYELGERIYPLNLSPRAGRASLLDGFPALNRALEQLST